MALSEKRYAKTHEWAAREGELIVVGVSEFAVEQLNREIVFVELPPPGKVVSAGQSFGTVEAVKTAADLYAPVSGVVEEVNAQVLDDPNFLAQDPEGAGWLIKVRPNAHEEWNSLLSEQDYRDFLKQEGHH
ncbi:MAG: glycine cleavage system protein GcvH [Candidatus Sumerlaeaceae bacterium]|nr:glycine cleavage system protein GcvH [Candidatus Sumerlaeaceae bacterium]